MTETEAKEIYPTASPKLKARLDTFEVLRRAYAPEVHFLREALVTGRVEGSVYEGECACLVGTIEKARGRHRQLPRNSGRPAERWFMNIHKGSTPVNNIYATHALGWIDEYLALTGK